MVFNPSEYRPDWSSIRRQILDQADNHCEWCGLRNGIKGKRDVLGNFWLNQSIAKLSYAERVRLFAPDSRIFRVVLTIAHLDQDRRNNDPANLRALCQRCHLNHDRRARAHTARGRFVNALLDAAEVV